MNFREVKYILGRKGILAKDRNIAYSYNRIKFHNQYETTEHFISKAMLTFLIFCNNEKGILTEVDFKNGRTADALQVSRDGQLVAYEIESEKNTKKEIEGVDTVEIPLRKMPMKAREGIKELEKWLSQYLIT
jgi:hypothetical protein